MECARLSRYGLLSVQGADAREFLHAQLTNDIRSLPPDRAALAGWCSAKGRLLASFLVVPAPEGFLLQLARDLLPAVQKRLSMFVLRSKVKIEDASDKLFQFGTWGGIQEPAQILGVATEGNEIRIRVDADRCLVFSSNPAPWDAQ